MNWKVFITAFVSVGLLALPQNSFTCGGSEDPYDYYTSFFNNKAGTSEAYKPFYYTALLTFYDDWDWDAREDSLAFVDKRIVAEWAAYGKANRTEDAIQLVYLTGVKEKASLLGAISGNPIPASLAKNTLAQNLVKEKNSAAIGYLLFASKTERISSSNGWEDRKKDSLQLNKDIAEATQAYSQVTDPFIKNKYAFQRCKLAFYNNRYADCIRWYDEHFNDANTSAVNQLALSYKAGSLFRLARKKEAAYAFSKSFMLSDQQKRNNFLGFFWSTENNNQKLIPEYTALCRNNTEKANMIGLFSLHGSGYALENMQKVYELNPSSPLLSLLATREINKLEEQHLTSMLSKEKGGKQLYFSWMEVREGPEQTARPDDRLQATKAAQFFEKLAADKNIADRSFYSTGAAYLHFMNKNYDAAKKLLAKANDLPQTVKVKEQAQLIQLLIAANEGGAITKEREAQLLPAMKWLVQKAKTDKDYGIFCRNFFSEILSQKYEQQNDIARAALAYGLADLSFLQKDTNNYYSYGSAIEFVQTEMTTENLVKLYDLATSPATETEKFLVQHSSVKRDNVVDVLGTSYLRDRNYAKAIEWLAKAGRLEPLTETQYNYQTGKEKTVNVDPFYDYLNDWQRFDKSAPAPYTKLTLAKKLSELKAKIDAPNTAEDKSRLHYQYASALYNMSYYGNSWNAVAYYRSSSNWNMGNHEQPWEKEHYGVYEARAAYQKAYELATEKEFKAACLFMVAKCAQRQVVMPPYDYKNHEQYEKAMEAFNEKFKNNPLFAKFKTEFGTTKFYQYAYNRCSYLRDYIKKGTAPTKPVTKPKGKG